MAMFMRGISRVATPPANRQVAALRIADLRTVCRHLQALETKPSIVRDRAILALSLAGLTDGAIARLRVGRRGHPAGWGKHLHPRQRSRRSRPHPRRRRGCQTPRNAGWTLSQLGGPVAEGHGAVFTALSHPHRQGDALSPKAVWIVRSSSAKGIG